MICLAILTEYRRVTDGRTDILRQRSPRYAQHRAEKELANAGRDHIFRKFSFTATVVNKRNSLLVRYV